MPEEQGHRGQVDQGHGGPGQRAAHQPGQPGPQQQREADLGHAEGDGGQCGRVQVRDRGPVHAHHARRIAGPGDQHRGARAAGGEHDGRDLPAAQRPARPRDPEQVGDQPAGSDVDPAEPAGSAEAEPGQVCRGDNGGGDERGRGAEPADQRLGQRGQRGEPGEHAQEPQRVEDQRHQGPDRPGTDAGEGHRRGERHPDGDQHRHRAAQPGQAPAQPGQITAGLGRGGAPEACPRRAGQPGGSGGSPPRASRAARRRVPADEEEDREGLEDPRRRGQGGQGGQRAGVVQPGPGRGAGQHERGDQPVAEDHPGDGQRAERVDAAVPPGRGGRVDARRHIPDGEAGREGASPRGQRPHRGVVSPGQHSHGVTFAGSPSAM